jgi:hypothetical protein
MSQLRQSYEFLFYSSRYFYYLNNFGILFLDWNTYEKDFFFERLFRRVRLTNAGSNLSFTLRLKKNSFNSFNNFNSCIHNEKKCLIGIICHWNFISTIKKTIFTRQTGPFKQLTSRSLIASRFVQEILVNSKSVAIELQILKGFSNN